MRSDAFQMFTRAEWARLRASTPLTLTEAELETLRGLNESVSLEELAEVYLPLSRLLNLHIRAARNLNSVTDTFLGRPVVTHPTASCCCSGPPFRIPLPTSITTRISGPTRRGLPAGASGRGSTP